MEDNLNQAHRNQPDFNRVPAPQNATRERHSASYRNEQSESTRKQLEIWGPALLVLVVNIFFWVLTVAYTFGAFSERIDGLEDDIADMKTTTDYVEQEIAEINEKYARTDMWLEGLDKRVERLTTVIDSLNETIIRLTLEIGRKEESS